MELAVKLESDSTSIVRFQVQIQSLIDSGLSSLIS